MSPKQIAQLVLTAGQFHEGGKLAEAEGLYRQARALDPQRADAACGLGLVLSQQGRHEEAVQHLQWKMVWDSNSPMLLTALGSSMLALGGVDGAVECAARAVEIDPAQPQATNLLGCGLLARGDAGQAARAFLKAIELQPTYVDAYFNLGCTLATAGQPETAVGFYDGALRLNPRHVKAYLNRGFALRELGRLDEALASFRKALECRPDYSQAMHNIGSTLAAKGRVHEALEWIRRALAAGSGNMHAHSALVYLMNFDPECNAADRAAEARRWNNRYAAGLLPAELSFSNERVPERRLRVGYVSPDFRGHAESWFMLPLLAAHDRQGFEIHCYSSVRRPDGVTERLRGLADQWHEVARLSDTQLAQRIRADGIDILVDLTLHMEDHRLLTFARKPAPVQVAWLGYPAGTGLGAMDYRVTDGSLLPLDAESGYPEKPLRLPGCWFCYQPSADAPAVGPPPCAASAVVTFGSLNSYQKMSPGVLELWARTLAAVQAAGRKVALVMTCPEGDHRDELLAIFGQHEIAADQIKLLGRMKYEDYLAAYQRIDIALDPFPHNGATTTCEALWMGVPVLTLAGTTEPGRLGASILTTVGLEDWIGRTHEEFVAKAVAFSRDAARLAKLREEMRDRLRASPLLDAAGFARNMEAAYWQAWRDWCDQK